MRICLIGKFPPIQGGVSMRTYWNAHRLAARGHDVQVVTNAQEASPPFRMHMRARDWKRCEKTYGRGAVTVHWTDPADRSQYYLPMASPFVSKLAGIAARLHSERRFDVILSHYLEPYGVAAHLVAQMTGVPHVARMAGSDAGRLWHHPQLEPLYDHVLRSARLVIAAGKVALRAIERGVEPDRIVHGGGFLVPEDVFTPDGPRLDFSTLRAELAADADLRGLVWGDFAPERPHLGIYGKLGDSKGSFALLAAMARLKRSGRDVGLVALAHGRATVQEQFRARAIELGLTDRILQIPFLPHWRVPEFLRGCLAVCCLEQGFPIAIHTPIIPREVLLCGACLVGSTEVIRKLPSSEQLPSGYGCVALDDVKDADALAGKLAAIVDDPAPMRDMRARGRAFALELQRNVASPQALEDILKAAAARPRAPTRKRNKPHNSKRDGNRRPAPAAPPRQRPTRFPLTAIVRGTIERKSGDRTVTLTGARKILSTLERRAARGDAKLRSLALAVRTEIAIAQAENTAAKASLTTSPAAPIDPLFRLSIRRWAMEATDLPSLVPVRLTDLRVVRFDYDVSVFLGARTAADLAKKPVWRPSTMLVPRPSPNGGPLLVDGLTARILELSDGARSVSTIVDELRDQGGEVKSGDHLQWIEELFRRGLLGLHDA